MDRPRRDPLAVDALRAALHRTAGSRWKRLDVVASTASTNADLAEAARSGRCAPGHVLAAELQTAGRGRLGRSWTSPPRAGLTVSALVAPHGVPPARLTWLPLLTGLALAEAVDDSTGGAVRPDLKWPNDLLVDGRKLAGVLVELVGRAAVLGSGTNVSTTSAELPAGATSLLTDGVVIDRSALLLALLARLDARLTGWEAAAGDAAATGLADAYARRCSTLGRRVRVELPGGTRREGRADAIDPQGRLVVDGSPLGAGDVVHVR